MRNENPANLDPKEIQQGWHFCPDWDGLVVGPVKDSEWGDNIQHCLCGLKNPNTNWLPE